MCNDAFHKLITGFNVTYEWNEKFQDYVDSNFACKIGSYGEKYFSTDDMKKARKFWKQNAKKHPNYPWFDLLCDVYEWIDNMPIGGYEY